MNGRHLNTNDRIAFLVARTQNVKIPDSHADCFVCGHDGSLGVRFHASDTGVKAHLHVREDWQGYAGIMHGGMIATLLDAAMTHCLFHHGIEGLTADLQIRYLDAVPCSGTIDISASLTGQRKRIYELSAELSVAGKVKARARARFMRHISQLKPNNATRHASVPQPCSP